MNMNIKDHVESTKVVDAIAALKEKAESADDDSSDKGVDLLAIVKKLSRNRDRVARNGK